MGNKGLADLGRRAVNILIHLVLRSVKTWLTLLSFFFFFCDLTNVDISRLVDQFSNWIVTAVNLTGWGIIYIVHPLWTECWQQFQLASWLIPWLLSVSICWDVIDTAHAPLCGQTYTSVVLGDFLIDIVTAFSYGINRIGASTSYGVMALVMLVLNGTGNCEGSDFMFLNLSLLGDDWQFEASLEQVIFFDQVWDSNRLFYTISHRRGDFIASYHLNAMLILFLEEGSKKIWRGGLRENFAFHLLCFDHITVLPRVGLGLSHAMETTFPQISPTKCWLLRYKRRRIMLESTIP